MYNKLVRVVEIGCGQSPGPRFDGADEYYAVDIDAERLKEVGQQAGITRIKASAANLPFEDASIDAMLARNVFGDPGLGLTFAEKSESLEADHLRAEALKTDILREAARVLISNGKLVVVEEYSPSVAGRYFSGLDPADTGLSVRRADLKDVVPADYEMHVRQKNVDRGREYKVWTATKT